MGPLKKKNDRVEIRHSRDPQATNHSHLYLTTHLEPTPGSCPQAMDAFPSDFALFLTLINGF